MEKNLYQLLILFFTAILMVAFSSAKAGPLDTPLWLGEKEQPFTPWNVKPDFGKRACFVDQEDYLRQGIPYKNYCSNENNIENKYSFLKPYLYNFNQEDS